MMRGVVGRTFEKVFDGKTFHSFTLKGQDGFFRTGMKKPPAEGSSIQFDIDHKNNAKNIAPWESEGAETGTPVRSVAAKAAGGGPATADQFWRNKEVRDVETQKRIELQSCRNSALELVKIMLAPDVLAVKLPAKQADKTEVVEELVAHYTKKFLDENKTGLDNQAPAVDTKAVQAVDSKNEKKEEKVNDDSDWS